MDPHPLASELSALDFLYGVFLEMRESENRDEEIYEVIHEGSLNEKHDCNDFIINSFNDNHAKNMQNPKLGDASSTMSTTCCNDLDWGDDFSYDLEKKFNPHDDYDVCNNIESGFGEVTTLVDDNPIFLKSVNFACMWIMKRISFVIAILLNLIMIPHVIAMREENIVVETFMLPNYLSLG